ncbi:DNA internalization-related competence protein ComEC/Rec2 [Alteromonas sp. MB-3u-76]|uniref:DNA internalization-related competence protein ComEC/Rec2 n=1 Tax=Alteromonas sp. MB-3u-76 TaxID=2058133 RepID=UPI000C30C2E1|nr:DNA internalization-related competence protein ComEC/Rec2 [Alteromonas sp. MB-3u-76]AUC88121.1 DNA internalization-related competence protein ComEC/Rec2 [Alteromonas sp. MB-3u-76]
MVNRITIWLFSFCVGAISAVFWPRLPSKSELFLLIALVILLLTILATYHRFALSPTTKLKPEHIPRQFPCQCASEASFYTFNRNLYKVSSLRLFPLSRRSVAFLSMLVACGALTGVLMEASVGYYHYAWQLPKDKIQKDIILQARVLSGGCIPNPKGPVHKKSLDTSPNTTISTSINTFTEVKSHRYMVEFIAPNDTEQSPQSTFIEGLAGKKGRLTAPTINDLNQLDESSCLHNGDIFLALVKLKPSYSTQNPVGANQQKHLMADHVHVTGYIKKLYFAHVSHRHSFRLRMASVLNELRGNNLQWWQALLLGLRGGFTPLHWELLQVTGTGHLFSISGMHLGVVAGYVLLFCCCIVYLKAQLSSAFSALFASTKKSQSLFKREHLLASYINYRHLVISIVWIGCGLYTLLSGLALPVVRAYVLLTVASVLTLLCFTYRPLHLAVAMVAVSIALFPLSILSASFYLSVSAVLYIWFLVARFRLSTQSFVKTLFSLQILLSIFMIPVTVIFFSTFSVVGLLANIIAVPIITLLLPPALLVLLILTLLKMNLVGENRVDTSGNASIISEVSEFCISAVEKLFSYLDTVMTWLIEFLKFLARYENASIDINLDAKAAVCALAFMFLLIGPRWRYKKVAVIVLLVPLLTLRVPSNPKQWNVHVLDAGQASAIAVVKAGRALVIDSGASYRGVAYTASEVLLPLLNKLGIESIDYVFHTHKDNDHAGGKATVANSDLASRALWFSPTEGCEQGKTEKWQGLRIDILWPLPGNSTNDNNHSCVIKISDAFNSILLPGDIERSTEYALLNTVNAATTNQSAEDANASFKSVAPTLTVDADILIAPHHGSNTSSTSVFVRQVNPKAIIITQGFENRWKFPALPVIQRYEALGVPYYLSSYHGYIKVTLGSSTVCMLSKWLNSRFENDYCNHNVVIQSQRFDLNERWYLKAIYPSHL